MLGTGDRPDRLQGHPFFAVSALKKAAVPSCVAGDSRLVNQQQQGVAIAVDPHLDQSLYMARTLTLAPQPAARPRPVASLTACQSLGNRFAAHPGQPEHPATVV